MSMLECVPMGHMGREGSLTTFFLLSSFKNDENTNFHSLTKVLGDEIVPCIPDLALGI